MGNKKKDEAIRDLAQARPLFNTLKGGFIMNTHHTRTPPINEPQRRNRYCQTMAESRRSLNSVADRASATTSRGEGENENTARRVTDAGIEAAEVAKNEALALARRKAYQKARIRKQYAEAVRQAEKAGNKATGGAARTTAMSV